MDNPFSLQNKVIVISGATSGIGKECAFQFAQQGAKLILLGRNKEKLQALLSELKTSDNHIFKVVDLDTELDKLSDIMKESVSEMGKINGLLHSAGIESTKPLKMLKTEDFEAHFRLNVTAAMMLAKEVSHFKNKAEQLSMVFIASVMGSLGEPGKIDYCSSKGALVNGVKALALELAKKGVRANTISPAMVETPMAQEMFESLPEESVQNIKDRHPLGLGKPLDIAYAAQYLLSDASRWVTGSDLKIDGGYSAQ